ncbi:MAG: hypothetical protein A3G18_01595 [Rhodospirillales bacterium RIFCSPLOWO2_12_FULL_58_28]|nr:MAG: hypothetical protein A3H92_07925 [Rhodospirillales bacterium RIFCSPLOWO2_02_FULL_58_16]OHC78990.1 MAG: hypothetical protein A3G18_01595 [Rhodospirillales bacterium RIFCSPLOWO2_12_FULL_58_28]
MAVRVSYKCNIGCSHCYNQSIPGNDVVIDEGRLLEVIKEGAGSGFNNIGITGGEALLHAGMVLKALRFARDSGYKGAVSLMTNGFWGKTESSAGNMVRMLGEAGFSPPPDRINLSAGEYHQEWIPIANIKNVVQAYYEAFKAPINLDFEYAKGNDALLQKLLDYFAKYNIPKEAYNLQHRKNIALLGRGRGLSIGTNPPAPVSTFGLCKSIGRFVIQPDAKVVPCCGFNRFNRGIILGDVYKSSVAAIIEDTNKNIIYQYLLHKPMHEIHRILSKKFKLRDSYTSGSACEPCEEIFGKEEHISYLESVANVELAGLLHPESKPAGKGHFHDEGKNPYNNGKSASSVLDKMAGSPKAAVVTDIITGDKGKVMQPASSVVKTAVVTPVASPVCAKPDDGVDLAKMSVTMLNRLIDDATAARDKKIREERDLRIRQIKQMAKEYNINLRDLLDKPQEKTPVPQQAAAVNPAKPAAENLTKPEKTPEKAAAQSPAKAKKPAAPKKAAAKRSISPAGRSTV